MLKHLVWCFLLIATFSSQNAFSQTCGITTFPWSENFESFTLCPVGCGAICVLTNVFTNPATDDLDWSTDEGGTSSSTTGPSVDHTFGNSTGNYLYVESSCSGTRYPAMTAELITPEFDISGLTQPTFGFWYHMFGASDPTMHLDVSFDNALTWALDIIPAWTANVDQWQLKQISASGLPVLCGLRFRVRGVTGTSFTSDMAVDDFFLYDGNQPATCQALFQYTLGLCPQVPFFDASTSAPGFIVSWNWDFGDGNTSTLQNPTHTYAANGVYTVSLTTLSSDSCVSTYVDSFPITCITAPTCQSIFQWGNLNCNTFQFQDFSNAGADSIVSWYWWFGDGAFSSLQNPIHTYATDSVYPVCLSIQTASGCIDSVCLFLTVACGPITCQSNFQYTLGTCPNVTFVDNSTASPGNIIFWLWDFGDGTSSNQQNPIHNYGQNGTYNVCLTTYSSDSCVSTYCDSVVETCFTPPTCTTNFQYTLGACPNVFFVDNSTSSSGQITHWLWDFGDGSTATTAQANHTYTANGTYLVTLVSGDLNCSDTLSQIVTITCIQPITCTAAYGYTFTSCSTVQFQDTSWSWPGNIAFIFWDFGDGSTSTVSNPSHSFGANGTYSVCLTVVSMDSCVSTECQQIIVNCAPASCQAIFQYTLGGCPTVWFFDASTSSPGNVSSWLWDFGDGGNSTQQHPQHTYAANGNYLACLTVVTTDSCISTFCATVPITCITGPTCQAFYQYSTGNCPTIDFFDGSSATNTVVSWFWDFGDGNSSTLQHPSHTYSANGLYVNCLAITTTDGCTSTFCDTILVSCITVPTCQAGYQYTLGNCPTIHFFDASTSNGTIFIRSWDFGDGGTSGLNNPDHTYTANGTYLVCLSVTTTAGCTSTFCDTIVISCIVPPSCQAFYQYSLGGCPTMTFFDASTAIPGNPNLWIWDFGDGNSGTGQAVTNTYAANGAYIVCLTMGSTDNCFSTFCDTVSITCYGTSCSPVTNLWTSRITPISARLNWDGVSGAHHYEIRGGRVGGLNIVSLNVAAGSPDFKDVFGLTYNAQYWWEIRAWCDAIETDSSDWSSPSFFFTDCQTPDSNRTSIISSSGARLEWNKVVGAAGYEIKGRKLGGGIATILVGGGNTLHKDVFGLLPNTCYEWQVRAWCDANGNKKSAFTSLDTFCTNPGSRLDSRIENELEFKMIPNPARDKVYFEFDGSLENEEQGKIRLMDSRGQLVIEENVEAAGKQELDVSLLPTGMYFVIFNFEYQQSYRKLLIER